MNLAGALFCSSIGRKFIMAATGVVLIFFIIGHLVGNLQIFQPPDHINGYAHFLRQLGPLLWVVRSVLLASVILHIWAGTALAHENLQARGNPPYGVKTWIRASYASRYVRWTGYIVLAFVLYHLAHFSFGWAQPATFKANLPLYTMAGDYHVLGFSVVKAGTQVPDVYSMMILGFQNPFVSIFYIIAVGLLSFHLLHGADSLFQTFGWRNERWAGPLRKIVAVCCLAYFLGNLIIPGAVL
ncbi:MAG: succinate dehydrogenase cytochrome b subunit, partial [Verrucomicrobiota bacterium]|nr:succinate dehydrogenase cytochrome b subunit [Verrucomicrobiota bacterium]